MSRIDRRTALKGLGALSTTPLWASCGDARPSRPLSDSIDTVVVLMMENRSFDHYFGSLSLLEGRTDVDGLRPGLFNLDSAGTRIEPYREVLGCHADPPHSWGSSHLQVGDGACDGFVREHEARVGTTEARRVMGYYTRAELPVSYRLADEYALCQRWYASVLGPTWPNRFYLMAAQSGGVKKNDFEASYAFPTMFDRVLSSGRDFRAYYGNISLSWMLGTDYTGHYAPLESFYTDAAAGTLPAFSLVEPIYGRNDDHPPAHPLAGQLLIASVYDALAKSPQWGRSLLVVTYDEHGGFYDHVAPPKTADDFAADGFDQLGVRVPSLVLGPYVKRQVSSTLFDHSSVSAMVQTLYGVAPLTARDRAANDLTGLLDMARIEARAPAPPIALEPVVADEAELYAAGCVAAPFGSLRAPAITGQPELEQLLERSPRGALDRRARTDDLYQRWLAEVEARGLLSYRTR